LVGLLLIVVSVVIGMIIAYSFPEGFPGAYGPPADQKQAVLSVSTGELDSSHDWVKDVSVYLIPFFGIEGSRSYSALIIVPGQGKNFSAGQATALYLEAKNTDVIQPIEIDASDFVEMAGNRIVVKLLDEGPNSGQYYNNAQGLTLSFQPHPKHLEIINAQNK